MFFNNSVFVNSKDKATKLLEWIPTSKVKGPNYATLNTYKQKPNKYCHK